MAKEENLEFNFCFHLLCFFTTLIFSHDGSRFHERVLHNVDTHLD